MSLNPTDTYDLRNANTKNRLTGLWRLMNGYRLAYSGATLSQGGAALARTGTFYLLRYFVDQVLGGGHFEIEKLILISLGFIGLAALEGSFTYLSGRLAAFTAENVTRRLRNYLFDHIQRLSFSYHSQTPTGELIERCTSDVDALRRFFSDQAIGVGRVVLLFVINFSALLLLNWKLGLASVVVIPLILITSAIFFKKIGKVYESYQEQEAILSTTLQENLTGVRVVKAFARQEYERNKFEKDNREKFKRGLRLVFMNAAFWPLSDILCGLQMLGGQVLAAFMVIQGDITIGSYLAYMGLVGSLIWPMRNLGRLVVQTSTGLVSYTRVMEIIKQDRELLEESSPAAAALQEKGGLRGELCFEGVSFEYEQNSPVLNAISFHCAPGQSIALLGSTGSGKTTLVNLLPRFYDYTQGSLTLDGIELRQFSRRFLRQQIGIVEQEPFLFSRTIRENITYGVGREVSDAEVEQAARAAAIHAVIQTFPDAYNTLVGEKGVTLSGGQKQRVAIARTLLKDPRILILDDSTSSVDPETEAEIRLALEMLMKSRTTFIIAHRIQSVMNADLILVMDKGRIVQMGPHAELVAQPGAYQQIFEIQTKVEDELVKELAST